MVQPAPTPPSPLAWVQKLEARIDEQTMYAEQWEQRYANEYVLPFVAKEYREVYGQQSDQVLASIMEAPRAGAAAIGVDALVERLVVLGGESDDKPTHEAIKAAWEDSDLDVMHPEAHRESMVRRTALGAVAMSTDNRAIATIESSEQAAVHRMQGPPYDVDGYFKRWIDEWTGKRRGLLQLPGLDVNFVEGSTNIVDPQAQVAASRWEQDGAPVQRNWSQAVPAVEFQHRPRLLKEPVSEIERIKTLVDLADLIDALMVFAGHFGAVPIRWATGLDVPRDPLDPSKPLLGPDGKPMMSFKPRSDHLWFTSNKDAKFGQMVPASLDTYVTWSQWVRSELRAQTKVASTYYAFDLKSHMTAELLKTDEAPMVRRINSMGRLGTYNQAWRRLQTIMVRAEGHRGRVAPVWDDPNTRLEAQAMDAFQKAVTSGAGFVTAAVKILGWPREMAEEAYEEGLKQAEEKAAASGADPTMERVARDLGL